MNISSIYIDKNPKFIFLIDAIKRFNKEIQNYHKTGKPFPLMERK